MTRREALKLLADARYADDLQGNDDLQTAHNMAIDALRQEPCDDCISRQAVFDLFYNTWKHNGVGENYGELSIDALKALPSVNPQPKTGHWILTDDDFVYCSECEDSYYPRPIDASWYYCPHCGCRMVEPQGSEV